MIGLLEAFSQNYAQARVKFLSAAANAGLAVQSLVHPLQGIEGEELAIDVALDGDANAKKMLIVSSGCHGVEGYCGSGVQVFALHDAEWRDKARAQGVAVLYLHALNPYGFAWASRTTHENVDLNRNFGPHGQPAPGNSAYAPLHALLVPELWPPATENVAAIAQQMRLVGLKAFQTAVTSGQNAFADGLFYAGTAPCWSNLSVRALLRQHASRAQRLGWIDLHTGLGPNGIGERIYAGRYDAQAFARAAAWWSGGSTPVTNSFDGSSVSAVLSGQMVNAVFDEAPQAEFTGIALEYGTLPGPEVLQALRADQWLRRHPQASAAQAAALRLQVRDAFYVDTDPWKGQVISQARQAMFQAVDGLAATP